MSAYKALISFLIIGWVCIAQAQPNAYITNQRSDSVTVIDTATNKAIKTIKVGHRPAGVVVSIMGNVFISVTRKAKTSQLLIQKH